MTTQVKNLFNKVNSLPEEVQNDLIFFWGEDLENEIGFDRKISDTSNKLSILAQKALNDFKQGRTIEKGFDEL